MNPNITTSKPSRPATGWSPYDLNPRRERVTALGRIYLDAGLPLAAAFEAALADDAAFETEQRLCPT